MINFRFQPKVWDGCHDTIQKSVSLGDFAIVSVGRNDQRTNFWFMTKSEYLGRKKRRSK